MKKENFTSQLVAMAFLIALEIVLTRLLSINLPTLRIGFGFVPVIICAILFGPYWTALCYAVGDFIGIVLFTNGLPFPGFTLSAALTGLIYGYVFYKKNITTKRALFGTLCVMIPISLFLNTFWLTILVGEGFWVLFATRIFQVIILTIVQTITIPIICNKILVRVPFYFNNPNVIK